MGPKITLCAGLESVEEISVEDLMSQPPTPSWGAPGLLKEDGPGWARCLFAGGTEFPHAEV